MTIANRGTPKHAKPRRRYRRPIAALLIAACLAIAPCAAADTGVDTASYQGCWDGATAKAAGVDFAFVKTTEGLTYVNPYASCQIQTARANGIRLGTYDFARPAGNSPETDADNFVHVARQYGLVGQAIPVLDWEPSAPGGYWAKQTWWALRWLNRVRDTWGVKPVIYMSAATIATADWSQVAAGDYGLWVAGYPRGYTGERLRNPGAVPYSVSPWEFAMAWQYSSTGNVPGIGSKVDVNWFYGTAATWALYAGQSTAAQPTPAQQRPKPATAQTGAPVGDAETIATQVVRGLYGNGLHRRQLLGNRYDEVMAIVNRRLAGSSGSVSGNNGGAYCVIVSSGDTMGAIASRTGRTPASAWSVPSGNVNRIWPGQQVCYGGSTASSVGAHVVGTSHVVTAGESLWTIYGATGWQAAAHRNGLSYPYIIHPGQVLR